jgi:hypothetical protein
VALTPDVGAVVPALIGGTIGTVIGQRRLVRRHMPEQAERWFALSVGDRVRIRWAVARGNAVADARLAALAVGLARAQQAVWARIPRRRYLALWTIGAAVAIACIVALGDDGRIFYGGVIALAFVVEIVALRGRAARLAQAERRNLILLEAPAP